MTTASERCIIDANSIHPEDRPHARRLVWQTQSGAISKSLVIPTSQAPPCRNDFIDAFRLCQPQSRLQIRHSVVKPEVLMPKMPLRMESMVAQPSHDLLKLGIVRRHHAAFTRRDNLVGVERERSR